MDDPSPSEALVEALEDDLKQAHRLLEESIRSSEEFYQELQQERELRAAQERELTLAHSRIRALEEDLSRQPVPGETAQLKLELARACEALTSVRKTFQDIFKLTHHEEFFSPREATPVTATLALVESALEAAERYMLEATPASCVETPVAS